MKSQKHGDPCKQFPQQILIEINYTPGTGQSASQAPAGQFPGGYKQPVPGSSDSAGSQGNTVMFLVVCDGKSTSKGREREN